MTKEIRTVITKQQDSLDAGKDPAALLKVARAKKKLLVGGDIQKMHIVKTSR